MISVQQKTPLRVLHRRSLLNRSRRVYRLKTLYLNEHYFVLSLNTSAGTYVKEFVHGDFGRTVPNVSSILGTRADILQLDVTWLFDSFRGGGCLELNEVVSLGDDGVVLSPLVSSQFLCNSLQVNEIETDYDEMGAGWKRKRISSSLTETSTTLGGNKNQSSICVNLEMLRSIPLRRNQTK